MATVTDETPWEVALRLEGRLRAMLQRTVGSHRVDDAWSDVVLARITRVCELHNPLSAPLDAYVIFTMRCYASKWLGGCAERRREKITQSLPEDMQGADGETEISARLLDLKEVLHELSEYDRWILDMIIVHGYTVSELHRSTGTSRRKLTQSYYGALERAQALAAAWTSQERESA